MRIYYRSFVQVSEYNILSRCTHVFLKLQTDLLKTTLKPRTMTLTLSYVQMLEKNVNNWNLGTPQKTKMQWMNESHSRLFIKLWWNPRRSNDFYKKWQTHTQNCVFFTLKFKGCSCNQCVKGHFDNFRNTKVKVTFSRASPATRPFHDRVKPALDGLPGCISFHTLKKHPSKRHVCGKKSILRQDGEMVLWCNIRLLAQQICCFTEQTQGKSELSKQRDYHKNQ